VTSEQTIVATRRSLHAVAEHVLAGPCYRASGTIRLVVSPGGFATPPFGDRGTVVAVTGTDLVVRERGGVERRAPITTLRSAQELIGVPVGGPAGVYALSTAPALDEPLAVDPEAAAVIAGWFWLGERALLAFASEIVADHPGDLVLWPEHFDLGFSAAEVNYGCSAGDDVTALPYAYVGPWARPLPPDGAHLWNAPFGAVVPAAELADVDEVVRFFRAGRDAALP
jgi:hypothetical protein